MPIFGDSGSHSLWVGTPLLHSGGCAFIPKVQPGSLIALRGSLTRVWEGNQVLEQMAGLSKTGSGGRGHLVLR